VGYPLPRILIADDNSNIQRMAALALKDAGIEVIAVGNGEAAVRKLPEIMPDLVLADIFMPVRNGYEVCEFVKRDARYSSIPVLLLAGAFDPFDEQEAQRVHADGVLKKPFVPPDPLINAVKTLLAKSAGDRLMAVTVPVAAASAESGRTAVAAPRVLETLVKEAPLEAPEEFALPLIRDDLGTHEKAATLAPPPQSPAADTDEPESVVTASRDPSLGEPAFWVPAEESAEGEAEEAPDEDLTDHTWYSDGRTAPLRDDPAPVEAAPAGVSEHLSQDLLQDFIDPAVMEGLTAAAASAVTVAPTSDLASSNGRSAEDTLPLPEARVESAALEMEPITGAALSESAVGSVASSSAALPGPSSTPLAPPPSAPAPTPSPILSASEVPPVPAAPASLAWESEQAANEDEIPVLELSESLPEWSEPAHAAKEPEPESAPKEQAAKAEPDDKSEKQEAKSQEQAAKPESEAHPKLETAPQEQEAESEPEPAMEWPPAFIPAISSGANDARTPALQIVPAAHAATNGTDATQPATAPGQLPLALPGATAGSASLSPADMEAAIQRVMERMQPQIIELVTRDILRPLVEALVQQELKK
jgi:CheY-like chemotaxis protein